MRRGRRRGGDQQRADAGKALADDAEIEGGDAEARECSEADRPPARQQHREDERPAERQREMNRHRGEQEPRSPLLPR